ncbi:hypothetical protein BJ170DRAFT_591844 [Xylariales sp. AK1849]|nr:hypothetical protein BJ170DRAFT_591844 [Xylariales sp. AK1849]
MRCSSPVLLELYPSLILRFKPLAAAASTLLIKGQCRPSRTADHDDGKTLIGGGRLSLLKIQDTADYFDTSDPYRPSFKKSNRAFLSSIVDEIRAKPDGGFFITYMGSAVGTSPGRLVETDADFNIIHEWPEDVSGVLNILREQFDPFGLTIDWNRNLILTSDFVVPVTILKPTLGIQRANTLRLWALPTRTILNTITIPDKQLVVTDYFVQTGEIVVTNTPAGFEALFIDVRPNSSLSFNRTIDFTREFDNRGCGRPHSAVVFDLTDPKKPY